MNKNTQGFDKSGQVPIKLHLQKLKPKVKREILKDRQGYYLRSISCIFTGAERQSITMKISLLFLLLSLLTVTFGQEELVALNPVLKDHSISYTDPISVRSNYKSVATFDPRGMHHVYTITHTFLDLIQRDRILPDSLNASVILDTMSKGEPLETLLEDHWQELLLQYIGIVTAAICGLLMAITIPVAGTNRKRDILFFFFFKVCFIQKLIMISN